MYGSNNSTIHWRETLSTACCALVGIGMLGDYAFVGIIAILAAIASFYVTKGWTRIYTLSTTEKIIAYIPVYTGGLVIWFAMFIFQLVIMAARDTLSDL